MMEIATNQTSINSYSQETTVIQATSSTGEANRNTGVEDFNDIVMFSEQSLMQGKADELMDKLDAIYLSHVSAKDKKSLEKAYTELDDIFKSEQTTPAQDKLANKLFEKIDAIFTQAESTLTDEDKKRIDVLNQKIDILFEADDGDLFDDVSEQTLAALDPLEKELDDILSSTLTAEQKKELSTLHKQVGQLFDQSGLSDKEDKAIDAAFGKIDDILNKSFEALSDSDKQRVGSLEEQIDEVFNTIEQQSSPLAGYYSV
jgi:hypothetical protein